MIFSSAIDKNVNVEEALARVIQDVKKPLEGKKVHLLLCFIQTNLAEKAQLISQKLQQELQPGILIGCTAGGVIGGGEEVENISAIALWAAHLPEARLQPFYTSQKDLEVLPQDKYLEHLAPEGLNPESHLLLLSDPYTFDIKNFIDFLNSQEGDLPVIGGMASSSPKNFILFEDNVYEEGAVGCFLDGNINIKTIVSQGCRPFGEPFIVTDAEANVIRSIAGKPSLTIFQDVYQKASSEDKLLVQQGLFVGMVTDEYKANPDRGDFLIRGVVGVDHKSGALAVADNIETGRTIQFHLRDKGAAHEDFKYLLGKVKQKQSGPVEGALMFSCNGRGFHLFQAANHDISTLQNSIGICPTAGFFCAGEIGPVGGTNYLHGFTVSAALFSPKS